jgi:hypothetical protein
LKKIREDIVGYENMIKEGKSVREEGGTFCILEEREME